MSPNNAERETTKKTKHTKVLRPTGDPSPKSDRVLRLAIKGQFDKAFEQLLGGHADKVS